MEDLHRVYNQIINEETKAKRKIDDIGRKIKSCNRLHAEYLRDVMEEAIAYLNGIHSGGHRMERTTQVNA